MKRYLWGILFGIILAAFTAYVLMDTFVITRIYQQVPSADQISGEESQDEEPSSTEDDGSNDSETGEAGGTDKTEEENDTAPQTPVVTENSYEDGNISVTITEYREKDTTIYVADVQLSSAAYLKTALANDAYGKNVVEKTSEMAERNDAILAINGDYYGSRESGFVLRNGVLYRDTGSSGQEDLVIYEDGSFAIITETETSADQLLASGAQQILSFGPALVLDGQVSVTEEEEVGKAKTSNPRTAVGIVDPLHYLFVVSDGRTDESQGLSLYELAEFMQSLGAETAYNLDGGGSSTMYFNGEVVNRPTTNGRNIQERSVSDIVYIGY